MSIEKINSGAYNSQDTTGDEIKGKIIAPVNATIDEANKVSGEEAITVSNTTQVIGLTRFHTKLTTAHASSVASLANGTFPGQRKLITLDTIATGGDDVALAAANIHNASGTQATSVVLDAEDEFLLLEWTGAEWQAIYNTATIGTA